MISAWLVQIIFRLVNFVLISCLFTHVFIKYFYPTLKEQLKLYLNALRSCRSAIKKVMQKGRSLDKDIEKQRKDAECLLENVKKWHLYIDKEKEKHHYEFNIRLQSIKNIYKTQEENYRKTLLYKKVVPQVFRRATIVLQDEYQNDKEKAKHMIETILKTVAQDNE